MNQEPTQQLYKVSNIDIAPELKEVQFLMPISIQDRENLKQAIEKAGRIRDPLKGYFGKGDKFLILCGKNRLEIAQELNIALVPVEVYMGLSTKMKKDLAISDNKDRRHLNQSQKRTLVEYFLKLDPKLSDRKIAKEVNVDHKTVSKARKEAESKRVITPVKTTIGLDGKIRKRMQRPSMEMPHLLAAVKMEPVTLEIPFDLREIFYRYRKKIQKSLISELKKFKE